MPKRYKFNHVENRPQGNLVFCSLLADQFAIAFTIEKQSKLTLSLSQDIPNLIPKLLENEYISIHKTETGLNTPIKIYKINKRWNSQILQQFLNPNLTPAQQKPTSI